MRTEQRQPLRNSRLLLFEISKYYFSSPNIFPATSRLSFSFISINSEYFPSILDIVSSSELK